MKSIILCKGEGKDKPLTYSMGNKFAKKTSKQTRPISAVYLLVSLETIICGISLLLERLRERFRLCADNSFIARRWLMIGLIPGMCKRFQIKVDGHCYIHPIGLHHPLSGHYNPSLIWYKNLPVMTAKKHWQWELGQIRWSLSCCTNPPYYYINTFKASFLWPDQKISKEIPCLRNTPMKLTLTVTTIFWWPSV